MAYTQLWVLLEGKDDDRFLNAIKPTFENNYDSVKPWQYADKPGKKIKSFLRSIEAMDADYLFWRDLNAEPCPTARKNKVATTYGRRIDLDKVIVLVQEIESWYLAGLDEIRCKELRITPLSNTNSVTKEQFDSLVPDKFDSRIDFMVETLKRFSVDTARLKNKSFDYFMAKIQATKPAE